MTHNRKSWMDRQKDFEGQGADIQKDRERYIHTSRTQQNSQIEHRRTDRAMKDI
jgi:hypothetical protein